MGGAPPMGGPMLPSTVPAKTLPWELPYQAPIVLPWHAAMAAGRSSMHNITASKIHSPSTPP
eukprot:scaffold4654_cov123-Skeletonema_menzelii.AAC.14